MLVHVYMSDTAWSLPYFLPTCMCMLLAGKMLCLGYI